MKTLTPGIPCNKVPMVFWKIPGADEIPKGKTEKTLVGIDDNKLLGMGIKL